MGATERLCMTTSSLLESILTLHIFLLLQAKTEPHTRPVSIKVLQRLETIYASIEGEPKWSLPTAVPQSDNNNNNKEEKEEIVKENGEMNEKEAMVPQRKEEGKEEEEEEEEEDDDYTPQELWEPSPSMIGAHKVQVNKERENQVFIEAARRKHRERVASELREQEEQASRQPIPSTTPNTQQPHQLQPRAVGAQADSNRGSGSGISRVPMRMVQTSGKAMTSNPCTIM